MREASDVTGSFVAPDAGVVVGSDLLLAVAALAYRGPTRTAIARLKYAGAVQVAGPLAEIASPTLARLTEVSGAGTVVPVPIHVERLRQRGYNQAALLARHLARISGLPMDEVLERRTVTERQHRLDRASRMHNLRGAIRLRAGVAAPVVAILVDDILTTSATLEACASVLRVAGAREVYGLAIAREV